MRLQWVIFDLNGTLLDPRPISRDLPAPLNDEATALSLLNDTVFQAMADTLAGRYQPFTDYLAAALSRRLILAGHEPGPGVDAAVTAAGCLPPFPEAALALEVLAHAGLRIATITNSPTATAERALTAAGLRERFDHVVGSDTCQAYKPALKVYANGLRRIGADPDQTCMVAAHGWDLLGAHQTGMHTAWISRGEEQRLTTVPQPDVTGDDLLHAAQAIITAHQNQ
jgi:2-haloacid dehalogenase